LVVCVCVYVLVMAGCRWRGSRSRVGLGYELMERFWIRVDLEKAYVAVL
jgi:hypothetical protein